MSHFSKSCETKQFSTAIANGGIVGFAEGIIDDTDIVMYSLVESIGE